MLKKGDRLMCKKDFFDLKKNNFYKIREVLIRVSDVKRNGKIFINAKEEFEYNINGHFLLESKIYKLFYNDSEIRKIKLKKIINKNGL